AATRGGALTGASGTDGLAAPNIWRRRPMAPGAASFAAITGGLCIAPASDARAADSGIMSGTISGTCACSIGADAGVLTGSSAGGTAEGRGFFLKKLNIGRFVESDH